MMWNLREMKQKRLKKLTMSSRHSKFGWQQDYGISIK